MSRGERRELRRPQRMQERSQVPKIAACRTGIDHEAARGGLRCDPPFELRERGRPEMRGLVDGRFHQLGHGLRQQRRGRRLVDLARGPRRSGVGRTPGSIRPRLHEAAAGEASLDAVDARPGGPPPATLLGRASPAGPAVRQGRQPHDLHPVCNRRARTAKPTDFRLPPGSSVSSSSSLVRKRPSSIVATRCRRSSGWNHDFVGLESRTHAITGAGSAPGPRHRRRGATDRHHAASRRLPGH